MTARRLRDTARITVALALGSTSLAGCRVDSLAGAEYAGPRNRCDIGCPANSRCVEGACVAEQTSYPLLIEAEPPSSGSYAPGVTFTTLIEDRRGGTRDLRLPEFARVSGHLENAGLSLPMVLRLERVGAVPGMDDGAIFETKSVSHSASPVTPPLLVPPGDYYAFVSPSLETDLAIVPPVQLRNDETREPLVLTFPSGAYEVRVAMGDSFRTFNVALNGPTGTPLTDPREARDIKVIDETNGRLASTIGHTCEEPGKPLRSSVALRLAPELSGHRYTLRVEPARESCSAATEPRATIDYDLQTLDVEGRGGSVTLTMPPVRTVLVSGLVRAFGRSSLNIEGDVVLRSVQLHESVDSTTGRAWSQVTTKIRDGSFKDIVLPGTYRADIIPDSNVRSASSAFSTCVDCTVPSQDPTAAPGTRSAEFKVDGSGVLSFLVPTRVELRGSAVGFDNALFTIGEWRASTSKAGVSLAPTGSPLITRAQTGLVSVLQDPKTAEEWNLSGALDPGLYDFVVRTPEASGYPWLVMPRLDVLPAPTIALGNLTAPAPVPFTGVVSDPGGAPMARAIVRARALIPNSDPTKPPLAAVLVGETRADASGRYRLMVPSALIEPGKAPN